MTENDVTGMLAAAKAAHREGRAGEAESGYRAVLERAPDECAALYGLGMLLLQSGRAEDAAHYLRETQRRDPANPSVLYALGVALAVAGKFEDAAGVYRKLVEIAPSAVPVLNNLGHILTSLDRSEDALPYLRRAAELEPAALETQINLSIALMASGRHAEALACNRRIIALDPKLPEAHNNLGSTYVSLDLEEDAAAAFEAALALAPDFIPALNNLANIHHKQGRYERALVYYERACALKPEAALGHFYCGTMLARLGRHEDAVGRFRLALERDPNYAESRNGLGGSLAELGCRQEAIEEYERAIAIDPAYAVPYCNIGNVLNDLGRPEEALAMFEKALMRDPNYALAHSGIGNARKYQGLFAESRKAYERAVVLAPQSPGLHLSLALSDRFVPGDARLAALEELARDIERFPEVEKVNLHFALAKAYGDLKRHAEAFAALERGNAAKRRQVDYDETVTLENLSKTIAAFAPSMLAQRVGLGDPSDVPVFVVGMPRSGTTLVEQVIASHPQAFGAGELNDLAEIVAPHPTGGRFFLDPELLTPEWLNEIGVRYVGRLRALAPEAKRIVDKMPGNFRLAGLIHLALPNARIVHVMRDPLDTCFSCYSILFKGRLNYSYDLTELGHRYRAYETLMAHWHKVLPPGVMLDVRYEDMVENFEPEAKRLIEFCGLEWDERCLRFYETERAVRTASVAQVRQPLYNSSIGRWKPYAEWLGPLFAALGLEAPARA